MNRKLSAEECELLTDVALNCAESLERRTAQKLVEWLTSHQIVTEFHTEETE